MSETGADATTAGATAPRPSRLLFASCNSQHYEPVLWPAMHQRHAHGFVWAGDAVYGDDFHPRTSILDEKRTREATPAVLEQLLMRDLLEQPGYRTFTRRDQSSLDTTAAVDPLPVFGVFDDHDFGRNNGDKFYQYRKESAKLFVDFLEKSSSASATANYSLMKQRAAEGKGVYGVKVFDFSRPAGEELLSDEEAGLEPTTGKAAGEQTDKIPELSDRSVAVFLLDCRSQKTPWKEGFPDKYFLDYEADFLGEEQWQWFKDSLEKSTASVNVIVQGLQVSAERYWDGNKVEGWSLFPMARHRLYQTILKSGASAPVLVSGDVHMAELMRSDCQQPNGSPPATTRSLLEVTTSGMTHSWGSGTCARPKLSITCRNRLFQKALTVGMHWAHINGAWTDLVDLKGPPREGAKRRIQYSLERNFGEFEFDWNKRELIVRILGEEVGGKPLLSTAWKFDALSGIAPMRETGKVQPHHYQSIYRDLSLHGAQEDDWICIPYRGPSTFLRKFYGFITPVGLSLTIVMSPLILLLLLVYFCFLRPKRKNKLQKLKKS